MPTSRKRIGFLPNTEVKNIIDKICLKNNISQSRVTGILVEEALHARNLYNANSKENIEDKDINDTFNKSNSNDKQYFNSDKDTDIVDHQEYILVKEYLKYQKFKKILSIVESENKNKY